MPPNRANSISIEEFFQSFKNSRSASENNSSSCSLEKEFDQLVRRIQISDKVDFLRRHTDWRNSESKSVSMYFNSSWASFLDFLARTHSIREDSSRSLIAFCFLHDEALSSFKSLLSASKQLLDEKKMIESMEDMDEAGRLLSMRSHLNLMDTIQLINSHQSVSTLLDEILIPKYDPHAAVPDVVSGCFKGTSEPITGSWNFYDSPHLLRPSEPELQSFDFDSLLSQRCSMRQSVAQRLLTHSTISSTCDDVSSVYINLLNLNDLSYNSDMSLPDEDWEINNNNMDDDGIAEWIQSNTGGICQQCQQDDERSAENEQATEGNNLEKYVFSVERINSIEWDDVELSQDYSPPSSCLGSSIFDESLSVFISDVESDDFPTEEGDEISFEHEDIPLWNDTHDSIHSIVLVEVFFSIILLLFLISSLLICM